MDKEYTGEFFIGATTPSYDLETEVDNIYDIRHISSELVNSTAIKFTGNFDQIPPVFSAKKIDGKRAYEFARKGQSVEMKSKNITIKEFEIINFDR